MVESAIIKKSLVIHRPLTAGRWGLNKHSQRCFDSGEEAPCFPSCRGLYLLEPPWAPQATFQLATSWGSSPGPLLPAGLPPGDNALLRGLGCCEYPPACFVLLPFSASFFPLCPPSTSPFSLTAYFPIQKSFAAVGPLVLPSRLAEPAVPAAVSPRGDRGGMLSFIQCSTKQAQRLPSHMGYSNNQMLNRLLKPEWGPVSYNPPVSGVGF